MISNSVKVPFVDLSLQHQPIHNELEQAIALTIERGDYILGQAVAEFEVAFAKACGVQYGVGVSSGTSAIALGLQACGIGKGDEVIVPTNTFIATVIGVIQAGAIPILVDCDENTALIDLEAAAAAVTPSTKGIIPVHLYGQLVSPSQLLDFAQTHDLIIVEDCAQAHLAQREGMIAGSIGRVAGFSFYPSKNLGAMGNGGIVVTNDESIAKKLRSLRNYGASRKYIHIELGTNSRLDTLQAAILQIKLPYLADWNLQRNRAAKLYDELLTPLSDRGILPLQNYSGMGHIYHLYILRLGQFFGEARELIGQKLATRGIQTGIHYPIPCHLQPAYQYLGYQQGDFSHAEALSQQILSLPMYPGITDNQIELVCQELISIVDHLKTD
ncbi:MAG: DegT/DnrJ/EryC1/StrS family aminotransferase [Pleurocapsa sp.]